MATLLLLAVVCPAVLANEKIWYVNAATGADTNDGHSPAGTPPIGPKLTVAATVTASVEGDTIYIAPGTYTSTTALNPKSGQHWIGSGWGTVLEKTSGTTGVVLLNSVSGVTLENLKIQRTGSTGIGLQSIGCQACILRRVWADGASAGARLDAFDSGLIDQCQATSTYDAWVVNGRATTVQNTIGISTGAGAAGTGNSIGCFRTRLDSSTERNQQIAYQRCQAYSSRTASNDVVTVGWEVDGYGVVLLQNCTASVRSTAESEAGTLVGASAKANGVMMISGNCVLRTESAGTAVRSRCAFRTKILAPRADWRSCHDKHPARPLYSRLPVSFLDACRRPGGGH